MKIVFAQGNPGIEYVNTRHNAGSMVLDRFAKERDIEWKEQTKFNAYVAETVISGEKVILAKPTTFYNETGISARKLIDFYKLDPAEDLLVIHDDLAIDFGTIRVREQGSDAGNNGIKSLNGHIGEKYHRIRIGICNELREQLDDADFVLGKFSAEESEHLKEEIIPQAIELIEQFCASSLKITSHKTK